MCDAGCGERRRSSASGASFEWIDGCSWLGGIVEAGLKAKSG